MSYIDWGQVLHKVLGELLLPVTMINFELDRAQVNLWHMEEQMTWAKFTAFGKAKRKLKVK